MTMLMAASRQVPIVNRARQDRIICVVVGMKPENMKLATCLSYVVNLVKDVTMLRVIVESGISVNRAAQSSVVVVLK